MPRPTRFAPPGLALHVTQRGNFRQDVFYSDTHHQRYLDLLVHHCEERRVAILGYCLMANHVHLILRPERELALSLALMRTQGEYAQWVNHLRHLPGHLWQGRFYSCTLDEKHLLAALRYVELNPVRAQIVADPTEYRWSSAKSHAGLAPAPAWLAGIEARGWTAELWRQYLVEAGRQDECVQLRQATRLGQPFASQDSVAAWEACYGRRLRPRPPGRPALASTSLGGS